MIITMDTLRTRITSWFKKHGNGHLIKPITKLFIALWIPIALSITGIFFGIIQIDTQLELATLASHEAAQTELATRLISNKIRSAAMDVDLYTRSATLHIYAVSRKASERNRFLLGTSNVINEKPIYQSITYINQRGQVDMNTERVNNVAKHFKPLPAKIETLQKIFNMTMARPNNDMIVVDTSSLPNASTSEPILYLSKAMLGQNGEKIAVIIFGLNRNELTNSTINIINDHLNISLVNSDGVTIKPPEQYKKPLLAAIKESQETKESIWDQILNGEQGSFDYDGALIAYSTLYPSAAINPSNKLSINADPGIEKSWKVVSYLPANKTPSVTFSRYPHLMILYLVSIALASILAMFMTIAIHKRRQVSKKLATTVREMEDLYENAPCGYHSLDKNSVIIRINATELAWLGYKRSEVVGKKKFTDFLSEESQKRFDYNFKYLIEHGSLHDIEYQLVCKNDQRIDIILNSTATYNAKGHYIQSRTTMHNITARKQMENALRESEERSRNIMEFAPIGMAIVSLNGKFMHANKQLCDMMGFEKSELLKISLSQITHPNDLAHDETSLNEIVNNDLPFLKREIRYICKNGELVWSQVITTLLRDNNTKKPLYFISQFENITERKSYTEKIRQLAYHDSLTNLPNRQQLKECLQEVITHSERNHECFAIFFIDIDNFKQVNDVYGHDAGDDLLKQIAARLKSNVRTTDIVARPGGDEFVIILTAINDLRYIHTIADKIRNALNQPVMLEDHSHMATCSIGIARYPIDGTTMTDLIKRADIAMYSAKNAGKNQHQLFQEETAIEETTHHD